MKSRINKFTINFDFEGEEPGLFLVRVKTYFLLELAKSMKVSNRIRRIKYPVGFQTISGLVKIREYDGGFSIGIHDDDIDRLLGADVRKKLYEWEFGSHKNPNLTIRKTLLYVKREAELFWINRGDGSGY